MCACACACVRSRKKVKWKAMKEGGTYNLLAGVDSIDSKGESIVLLLVLVGDLEGGCFEARCEDKHVLELSLLHILGEAYHKDGRDFFGSRVVDRGRNEVTARGVVVTKETRAQTRVARGSRGAQGMKALCSQAQATESIAQTADMNAVRVVIQGAVGEA